MEKYKEARGLLESVLCKELKVEEVTKEMILRDEADSTVVGELK